MSAHDVTRYSDAVRHALAANETDKAISIIKVMLAFLEAEA